MVIMCLGLNQCPLFMGNGNNEVQSTTSSPEIETDSMPEGTVLAQVAQRSATYV